jgi:23S rRNA (uracil1939-C5)-methyltransferase
LSAKFSSPNLFSFLIESVDSLGQGVSKADLPIAFLPKTLPGEEGIAQETRKKGKVRFASVESFSKESDKRIIPECSHYQHCSGCHFLHTDYLTETQLKKSSLEKDFSRLRHGIIPRFIEAKARLGYRNRVQLHYNRHKKQLGLIRKGEDILPIPECLLPTPKIREKIKELYLSDAWLLDSKDQKAIGHLEIYQKEEDKEVSLYWNKAYAQGGFSQVNREMNLYALEEIENMGKSFSQLNHILDLFGGHGNLSQNFSCPTLVVDRADSKRQCLGSSQEFLNLNLYSDQALKTVESSLKAKVDWLILDPPRSGFKELSEFCQKLRPKKISYMSCSHQTQIRDLGPLIQEGYKILEIIILDFFPSTYHLETLVHLERL